MKRFLVLAAAVTMLPGCVANLGFQVGNSGKSATQSSVGPGGSSFSSSSVNARFDSAPAYGSILGVGVLGAVFGRDDSRRTPELEADRMVNEQDCRKPVESGSANLRCR